MEASGQVVRVEAPESTSGEAAMEEGHEGGFGISESHQGGGGRATVMGRTGPREERGEASESEAAESGGEKGGPAPPGCISFLCFFPFFSGALFFPLLWGEGLRIR